MPPAEEPESVSTGPATDAPNALAVAAPARLRELGSGILAWLKRDLRTTIIFAVLAFLLSWLGNIVIVAVGYNGIGRVPPGGAAVGSQNLVAGTIFWALAMAILFGLLAYRLEVGGPRFWSSLRDFPGNLGMMLRESGDAALARLLWGAAGALLVSTLLGAALNGVLAVGVLVILGGLLRVTITGLFMLAWAKVMGAVSPGRKEPPSQQDFSVVLIGTTLGFIVAVAIPGPSLKLFGALGAAVVAFLLSQRKGQPKVTLLLGIAGGVALLAISRELHALAADGGWSENGGDLNAWLNGGGVGVITDSQAAGWGGGLGALAGAGLGAQAAAAAGQDASASDGKGKGRRPFNQAEYDKLMAQRIAQDQKDAMDRLAHPDPDTKAFLDQLDQQQREVKALDDKFAEMEKRFKDLNPPKAVSVPNFDMNTAAGRDAALAYLNDNSDNLARIQALKQQLGSKLPDLSPGSKIATGPLADAIHDAEQPHLELQKQAQIEMDKWKASLTDEQRKTMGWQTGPPKK